MQDRIRILLILSCMMVLFMSGTVFGYTGKGTKANPYIVSSEAGLRGALTEHAERKSWIYIAVNDTVAITKTIQVDGGKYRIYAINGNQTIRRTSKLDAKVNDINDSKYCMRVRGDTQVVFGYSASKYKLVLNGNSTIFNADRQCSGWLYVHNGTICTIDVNCQLKNAMNNKKDQYGAPITSRGELIVNGEICNCSGNNGGAIKAIQGNVQIKNSANIHDCVSKTEGGVIHSSGGDILMSGGQIYNCRSLEEGGAFFVKGTVECKITGGVIKNNVSGASAGGVFAGYGATLIIGTPSGGGPEIAYNISSGSGGGVRCDGGNSELAGGTTYIYGGNIHHNNSGKYGGGIACGEAGTESKSRIIIKNTTINNNTSSSDGGGIWIPKGAVGIDGNAVLIDRCKIKNNVSLRNGGGIMLYGSASASNNEVAGNSAKNKGGGVFIDSVGTLILNSGVVSNNKCNEQGSGIYVKGKFKIQSNACVDTNNIVYLSLNTYVDVIGKLNKTGGYIAHIDSQSKENGTILVKADYTGTSASKELYYSGNSSDEYMEKTVIKKYLYYELGKNRCLRPSEKVNGYNNNYIILSEKYTVSYDKNTTDEIENMPKDQIKFWEENITISNSVIARDGYGINNANHWNLKKDGSGTCIKPGGIYLFNESKTLYAQWIFWTVIAKDRYYVVGQDVVLDQQEILKKVTVTDNNGGASYKICVKQIDREDGSLIIKGSDIVTDNYMNTLTKNHYILTLGVHSNKSSSIINETMNVYVIDVPLIKGQTRFISNQYINTLQKDSRWNISLKTELITSLQKQKNQGKYKINISNTYLKEIKDMVKENNYIITKEMNRKIAESW